MTVLNPPMMVAGRTDHNADDFRGALAASMVGQGSTNLLPRAGILPGWGAELSVAQSTPNMSVNVGSGKCFIPAPTNGHGGWYCVNDSTLNLIVAASNATNPRIDLVIARIADPQYYAGGDGLAAIKVITGVAAASPLVPTVPTAEGAYITLAQIAVAANATSIVNTNITLNTSTSRPYTVGLGGVLPVPTAAARTALTPWNGLVVEQLDTGSLWVYTLGAWQIIRNGADVVSGVATASILMQGQVTTFNEANGMVYSRIGDTVVGQALYKTNTNALAGGASLYCNLPYAPKPTPAGSYAMHGQWFANIRSEAGAQVNKSGFLQWDNAIGYAGAYSHAVDPFTLLRVWPNNTGGACAVAWNFSYLAV